ncbi:MAG: hypothetical protein KKB03_04465 [Nanoarchaeota archaeon]|nr:hypothetical protein [Nanoarchaeota archaeon]MBU1135428.1 hypothetical protein [Nanoarchaeota archaeon]MBU2520467.1 hypothetical protein [Nanoarchaeota archaeon]
MRGQIWSMDFIVSAIIFFIALATIMFSWNYIIQNTDEQTVINEMESSVLDITDVLVRSPGVPRDWTPSNVQSIGLASEENKLNETKVDYFMQLDYSETKLLLGIKNYHFYFELEDLNNQTVKNQADQNITKGVYPDTASFIQIPVERYALYRDAIVKLKFIFWSF